MTDVKGKPVIVVPFFDLPEKLNLGGPVPMNWSTAE
jgi:hypothetical protein